MIDFGKIRTVPIKSRKNLVSVKDFKSTDSDYDIIKNRDIAELAKSIARARNNKKQVILMIGAHLIKVGMSQYIIDLLKKGIITHLASNGAASIHDFEIALIGETSEDVAVNLKDGTFGMAEETGRHMNKAIKDAAKLEIGYGRAIGKKIDQMDLPYKKHSIFYWCYKLGIPATVHVAIGTDIIHQHPSCSGEAFGKASYLDFQLLADTLSRANNGMIFNIGSAVLMPEVFLKALTIVRNLGYDVFDITTANLDMIDHYRPRVNIVERPAAKGKGFNIIERHEKTIPNLYNELMKQIK